MSEVVWAEGVSKHYGNFTALDNVSFGIERGSIVGLIGPNGAGKTTTLKSILGLTNFDGDMKVLGRDPRKGRHHIMEQVCFISDVGVLPRWMRVDALLDYVEQVHPRFSRVSAEDFLASTNVGRRSRVRELSKGMVTQLHLAIVMAIDVDLLVLDEPTLGLDILYRKSFYDELLNNYFDHETSIIISTHQVEEIESLLTHLLFIDGGRIVLDSPMDALPDRYADVLVGPSDVDAALRLGPLSVRDMLGKKRMLFEDVDQSSLAPLGEIHVPSVADLFVAKMKRERV